MGMTKKIGIAASDGFGAMDMRDGEPRHWLITTGFCCYLTPPWTVKRPAAADAGKTGESKLTRKDCSGT
jgi:hypothetical protein